MSDFNSADKFFPGFTASSIEVGEVKIFARHAGSGPPLLLLHGIPETHLMWHKQAARLAKDFTVVAADLPGYGDSSNPPDTADHSAQTKRAMAAHLVAMMGKLGFSRFGVAGHDRGGRVAYRMALDFPDRIENLAVLDVIPTGDVLKAANLDFAFGFWVWSFLAQDSPLPEKMAAAAPQIFLGSMLDGWATVKEAFPPEMRAAYLRNFTDPATLHAICEEYRAMMTLDFQHDEADRGKRQISCPVLALWGAEGGLPKMFDVLAHWRDWADDVRGKGLKCGHFLPEEAPDDTFNELHTFFKS